MWSLFGPISFLGFAAWTLWHIAVNLEALVRPQSTRARRVTVILTLLLGALVAAAGHLDPLRVEYWLLHWLGALNCLLTTGFLSFLGLAADLRGPLRAGHSMGFAAYPIGSGGDVGPACRGCDQRRRPVSHGAAPEDGLAWASGLMPKLIVRCPQCRQSRKCHDGRTRWGIGTGQ
ncbi:MAG: hypothetical protein OWU84_08225 [Firmicutes bacterium]|nr:hypothetical protein [Bacillota bacterium]